MRKNYAMIAVVVFFTIAAMLLMTPKNAASQAKGTPAKGFVIPDSVLAIAKLSCLTCHVDGGKMMAMGKVNLSKWDTYSPDKQISKALDMCKEVTKGAMPPKGFKKSHPEGVPTAKQIKTICNWANSLKIK
jgi:hypothetical protein